jgi:hypothetical protein
MDEHREPHDHPDDVPPSIAVPPGGPEDLPDRPVPGEPESETGDTEQASPELTPSEPPPLAPEEDLDDDPTRPHRAF